MAIGMEMVQQQYQPALDRRTPTFSFIMPAVSVRDDSE